jgi:hypothetical protein
MSAPNGKGRAPDAVEALLEHAAPRLAPPPQYEQIVREAVRAEWQAVAGRARTRRTLTRFAIAATVLLGVAMGLQLLTDSAEPPLRVATIDVHRGSVFLVGEQSLLQEITEFSDIYAGQVIETAGDGGLSISWGDGGSLRVDSGTRIEFSAADSLYLRFGQIYFDSGIETTGAVKGSALEIHTDHGRVQHLGTQYMTTVENGDLVVRVREGRVEIDGNYVDAAVAQAGQQMTISRGARPTVLNISRHGDTWRWVEALAPVVSMDGKTTYDFLYRISRETGLGLAFETSAAEAAARSGELFGTIDTDPRSELALRMAGEDLEYRIDGGVIYVSIAQVGRE